MDDNSLLLKILKLRPVTAALLAVVDLVTWIIKAYPVWRDYMARKFLVITTLGLLFAFAAWQRAPHTPKLVLIAVVLTCSSGALISGFVDFKIDEGRIKRRTDEAFGAPPLSQFLENGFHNNFPEQLWGVVNGYNVILTPMHGSVGNMITIRIPVSHEKVRPDLEVTPLFKIVMENFVMMAKTDIENYLDKYNYFELMNLITQATEKLRELEAEPLKFRD